MPCLERCCDQPKFVKAAAIRRCSDKSRNLPTVHPPPPPPGAPLETVSKDDTIVVRAGPDDATVAGRRHWVFHGAPGDTTGCFMAPRATPLGVSWRPGRRHWVFHGAPGDATGCSLAPGRRHWVFIGAPGDAGGVPLVSVGFRWSGRDPNLGSVFVCLSIKFEACCYKYIKHN